MENKYLKRSHISEAKLRQVVRLFCEDMTAVQIASLTGLNRNTVNRLLVHMRTVIAQYCDATSPLSGGVEIDESYFGPRRVRGVRGRGAGRKVIVFELLKRNGKDTHKSCPMSQERRSNRLYRRKLSQTAPSTLTAGGATTGSWTGATSDTTELTMVTMNS